MMAASAVPKAIPPSSATKSGSAKTQSRPRRPNYNHIHRNLLPIEVHPLPVLIPHNPLSLVAIILSYLTQVLAPPTQPRVNGYFSSATSSIHVTDPDTTRKLWEMGFFGRGSLSRSEPTWLENQKKKGATAEENTAQRRAERRQQKRERARKEQEDINQRLSQELQHRDSAVPTANESADTTPINEMNGHADRASQLKQDLEINKQMNGHVGGSQAGDVLRINSAELNGIASVLQSASRVESPDLNDRANGTIHGFEEWKKAIEVNGIPTPPPTSTSSEASQAESRPVRRLQRTKTVRFSPTIEAREFDLSSPVISPIKSPGSSPLSEVVVQAPSSDTENQEHLNLSLEEAFFLSYGLGVLQVFCDDSEAILPSSSLLALFRRHSYSPPRSLSISAEPDDPFMLSYVAYHHYRSLGWVVRSGVKFSVDYLLYNRGPAFSHAEFAVAVLPSYSHSHWSETAEHRKTAAAKTKKTWWWLHGVNRVQTQVHKQLVLCYVDVPPPLKNEDRKGKDVDIGLLFSRYKVRDINVRRWTPNRSRD